MVERSNWVRHGKSRHIDPCLNITWLEQQISCNVQLTFGCRNDPTTKSSPDKDNLHDRICISDQQWLIVTTLNLIWNLDFTKKFQDIIKRRQDFIHQWQEKKRKAETAQGAKNPRAAGGGGHSSTAASTSSTEGATPASTATSTNYPFHPDQMDPAADNKSAASAEGNNDVKW